MTDATHQALDLLPCPFCGGGITFIEGKGQIWRGIKGWSDPQWYQLNHFGKLSTTDDFPRCSVEFRCRTEAQAIEAWNTRSDDLLQAAEQRGYANAMEAEQLAATNEKLTKAVEGFEELARLGNGDRYGNSLGNLIAQEYLAELTSRSNMLKPSSSPSSAHRGGQDRWRGNVKT